MRKGQLAADAFSGSRRQTGSFEWRVPALRLVVVAGLLAVTFMAMALTSAQMSDLRGAVQPLSRAMSWLEGMDLPFDMDHVAFFGALTCLARLLLPRVRWWGIALAVVLLAGATELMQFAVPGRTPKLSDARDDLVGGGIGLLIGSVPLWLARFTPRVLGLSRALLLAGVVMLPLQQSSPSAVSGMSVLVSDGLFAAAIAMRVLAWMAGGAPVRSNGFHGWLLVYLFAMGLACMTAWPDPNPGRLAGLSCPIASPYLWSSVGKWIAIAYLAVLAVLVADLARDPWYMKILALAWIAAAAVTSVISMLAIVAFYVVPDAGWLQPLLSHYGSLPPGNYPRVHSLFANANMLCNYLVVAVCLLLLARQRAWLGRRVATTLLACLLVAAAATISPGLGGLVLALASWYWLLKRHVTPTRANVMLAGGALIAALVFAGMWLDLADPFASESVRAQIWQQAVHTWMAHPWRGVGLTVPVVGVAFTAPSGDQQWLTDAHNTWLNVGGQAGLLGVFALAGLCAWLLRHGLRSCRNSDATAMTASALLLGFATAFIYGGLSGSFEDARHLWVLMGMLTAISMHVPRLAPDVAKYRHGSEPLNAADASAGPCR